MKTAIDIIKGLRAAGLSQSEISRRTGIPQPRLSRWENGSPPVGANDVLRLDQLLRDVDSRHACSELAAAPAEGVEAANG